MKADRQYDDFTLHDFQREIAHHERSLAKKPPETPPAPLPKVKYLSNISSRPLTWLWPGRIPFGHLTLLDAAPGSGLSLVALTLAARSRLLLAPDPTDDGRQLLLTPKHPLCTQPGTLAYNLLTSESGIPTLHWLGDRDPGQLARLCTGPLRSPYRQAILRFLRNSDAPQAIPDILKATSYDREAGRKMLVRMTQAGELVSPARGLYTTVNHPCLANFPTDPPSAPNVSNVPMSQMSQCLKCPISSRCSTS